MHTTYFQDYPVRLFKEHTREVFSLSWNLVQKNTFLSASWDGLVKLWDPNTLNSLVTYKEHAQCIYQAVWSPASATSFASASGDQHVKLWDARHPNASLSFHAHPAEVLCLDWSKYDSNTLVTGSVDKSIRVWDLRFPKQHRAQLLGHEFAVRNLKCSPHSGNIVGSTSYDTTARFWDLNTLSAFYIHQGHSEFVFGLDFSLFHPGRVATTGWDETVQIFDLAL